MAALLLAVLPSYAQKKEIIQARTYIKSGKDFDKADRLMVDLLKKNAANRENPKIYVTLLDAVEGQYIQANEKLYLKQKYDTAAFLNLTRRLYDIALSLDSIDARPNKQGRVKPEYRKENGAKLHSLRPNLYSGGTFHLRKNEYDQSFDFFSHYLDAATQPLFASYRYAETDKRMSQAAYWATYCGYRMHDADKTLQYAHQALADTAKAKFALQYMCEAYQWQNRQDAYLETLREGFRTYPEYPYFFPRLADYYTDQNRNDSLLIIADQGLAVNEKSTLFLMAKSMALLHTDMYEECIAISQQMINQNDTLAEPNFTIATCYLNQTLALEQLGEPRKYRKDIQLMYSKARPYMERYRQLMPDDRKRWAPALYRIYLNLNLGKQFEEIDKLMR